MSFLPTYKEVKKIADKFETTVLEGNCECTNKVEFYAEEEESIEIFIKEINKKGVNTFFYSDYFYDAEKFIIPTYWIHIEKFGEFTLKIRDKVIKENEKIMRLNKKRFAVKISAEVNGVMYLLFFSDDEVELTDKEDRFNELQLSVPGLEGYLEKLYEQKRSEEEMEKIKAMDLLKEDIINDAVFLVATKGAKVLRIKEIAFQKQLPIIAGMSRTELELYADLMMAKQKVENPITKEPLSDKYNKLKVLQEQLGLKTSAEAKELGINKMREMIRELGEEPLI